MLHEFVNPSWVANVIGIRTGDELVVRIAGDSVSGAAGPSWWEGG
jgi:hypothetical protein